MPRPTAVNRGGSNPFAKWERGRSDQKTGPDQAQAADEACAKRDDRRRLPKDVQSIRPGRTPNQYRVIEPESLGKATKSLREHLILPEELLPSAAISASLIATSGPFRVRRSVPRSQRLRLEASAAMPGA